MKDDLWVWRYALEAGGRLNARTDRVVYRGALIRQGAGFGCVHPWPELGDPELEECLSDLAGERKSRLVQRTMACVAADAAAREEGCSLFVGLEVPESHATLPGLSEEGVSEVMERGFARVKVKSHGQGAETLREVRQLIGRWPMVRWRIDFNEGGDAEVLLDELAKWTDEEKGAIDFLEDPVPYHGGAWETLAREGGVALANDRWVESERGDSAVLVVKPAVHELVDRGRVTVAEQVVTSYMDHPVGQVFAAWEAARAGVKSVCGLQTHGLFKPDAFTERLGEVGPRFRVPEGTGLGFDDLLESLPWERLSP